MRVSPTERASIDNWIDWREHADQIIKVWPNSHRIRKGQKLIETLDDYGRRDLVLAILAFQPSADCYYTDAAIPEFMEFVDENWEKTDITGMHK